MTCFALLDDCAAAPDAAASRLYTGLAGEIRCDDPRTLDAAWAEVEHAQRAGLHAVIVADYEWGTRLHGIAPGRACTSAGTSAGLSGDAPAGGSAGRLRILLFARLERLCGAQVDAWLADLEGAADAAPAGVANLRPSVAREAFRGAIERIHEAIRAGETYQVNYTLRLHFDLFGPPVALYRRLRAAQPVAFGAFIRLPGPAIAEAAEAAGNTSGDAEPERGSADAKDRREGRGRGAPADDPRGEYLLSCSPELFLRHQAGRLVARPMKGTASRSADPAEDERIALRLGNDVKNRAENLMIVDLLRNDLGRIATTGSVRVPALFTVEPYPTVFQMTSTVEAVLPEETAFPTVLRALFPCGSITGAPKHRTMQLITELETESRGIYTGGIGWIDAAGPTRRCGDFCLSVAIRTMTLGAARDGLRRGRMGVGAGIVIDSRADAEYDESMLKARFLTRLDPGFALIETMHARGDTGVRHLDRHLARLAASAETLGFECDIERLRIRLVAYAAGLPDGTTQRVRLQLHKDGSIRLHAAALAPLPEGDVAVLTCADPVDADAYLLRHKTTHRARYDAALRIAEARGAFDMLFFNDAGELTEGARSNVFVRLDGHWLTPPLAAGVLPGIMRGIVLEDPAWDAREARLTRADLARAERIMVCNALRGPLMARMLDTSEYAT